MAKGTGQTGEHVNCSVFCVAAQIFKNNAKIVLILIFTVTKINANEPVRINMKFQSTLTTTIDEVLIDTRGNQTKAAEIIGITRSTLTKYMKEPEKIMLVQIDGKLTPFVSDRRNGHYKKA